MKLEFMRAAIFLAFAAVHPAAAQITSVAQLVDVKPADGFHADLQSLVERWGVLDAAELRAAAKESGLTDAAKDHYFPALALTRRQLAISLDTALARLADMAVATEAGQRDLLTEAKIPEAKAGAIFNATTGFSAGLLRGKPAGMKVDAGSVRGLSRGNEEYAAMRSLLERRQVGGSVLLDPDGSFTPAQRIGEMNLASVFSHAIGIRPEKRGNDSVIGGLSLNLPAREMTRGRFAMILNRYLDAALAKLDGQLEATRKAIAEARKPAAAVVPNLQTIINRANAKPICYKPSSPEIAVVSEPLLDEIAALFKHLPAGTGMEIAVHTDSGGNEAANLKLTQARANSVKAALVRRGISGARLSAVGFGSRRSIADNGTEAGRLKNRRTEFNARGF